MSKTSVHLEEFRTLYTTLLTNTESDQDRVVVVIYLKRPSDWTYCVAWSTKDVYDTGNPDLMTECVVFHRTGEKQFTSSEIVVNLDQDEDTENNALAFVQACDHLFW